MTCILKGSTHTIQKTILVADLCSKIDGQLSQFTQNKLSINDIRRLLSFG